MSSAPPSGEGNDKLARYRSKRHFEATPEPVAAEHPSGDTPEDRRPESPSEPERPGAGWSGSTGGGRAAVAFGLARRFRLPALTERHSSTGVLGVFAFVNGLIAVGAMAFVAYVTGEPFVFPSLGPTAFLLFYTPLLPVASPRNALGGHLVGAAAGYLALVAFGLTGDGAALATSVTGARVGAAALSLGLTSGAMVWARVPHPPAGATTLIVSLGILSQPRQLAVLMLAVALLVAQGFLINRLAGIPYPVWRPKPAP